MNLKASRLTRFSFTCLLLSTLTPTAWSAGLHGRGHGHGELRAHETRAPISNISSARKVTPEILSKLELAKVGEAKSEVELNSGIRVDGKVSGYILDDQAQIAYLSFIGPTKLSELSLDRVSTKIKGQGETQHPQGFGTAIGNFTLRFDGNEIHSTDPNFKEKVEQLKVSGNPPSVELTFDSGVLVSGALTKTTSAVQSNELLILTFENCRVTYTDGESKRKTLFAPSWGVYDMALGTSVVDINQFPESN